jgi:hypothetical protein
MKSAPRQLRFSLAPGFSRVTAIRVREKPFQRFRRASEKPLKRLKSSAFGNTRLKPGANEMGESGVLEKAHALSPLTLTLSLGEREQQSAFAGDSTPRRALTAFWLFAGERCGQPKRMDFLENRRTILPLPKGEGRGEGEGTFDSSSALSNARARKVSISSPRLCVSAVK